MSPVDPIVITGATGKQGGSVLRAVLEHPSFNSATMKVFAIARNPASAAALKITSEFPTVKFIPGDFAAAQVIFNSLPLTPRTLYAMTPGGKLEVENGKALIDAAVKAGVRHIVFSSVDRGSANGGNTLSGVPHWDTKHEIEAHLRKVADQNNGTVTYTIIRPTFFFDNLNPGFPAKITANVWRDYTGNRRMKLVDTKDIGAYAAAAIFNSESPDFKNVEMNLAGDELTFDEANEIMKTKTGHAIPTTAKPITGLIVFMAKDLKMMAGFLKDTGYGAEVGAAKKHITVTDFAAWVDRSDYVRSGKH